MRAFAPLVVASSITALTTCAPHHVVEQPAPVAAVRPTDAPLAPFIPPYVQAEALNTEFYLGTAEEERAMFQSFVDRIHAVQRKQAQDHDQPMSRGFHAKAHGCMTGWFQLFPDRDPRTRFGVFADGQGPWPVWARFSNGVGWKQSDDQLDARGFALKLMGVPGDKLIDEEHGTQDFLMTNAPTPVGRDAVEFMKFAESNAQGTLGGVGFAAGHLATAGPAITATGPIASAAAEQYWSGGAYHLGAHQAVKYTAKPCTFERARHPGGTGENRLRQDLQEAARDGVCFTFYVQFQTDPYRTPIENASREWAEADSPLIPVGKIWLPPQQMDAPNRDERCTQLSYNPWHAIPAHQPMGHINRARRFVYSASRELRNGGPEPVDFEGYDQ